MLNGLLVASEFAFVGVRSTSVEQSVGEGRARSAALQDVVSNLDGYLAATQLRVRQRDDGRDDADGSVALSVVNGALGTEFKPGGFDTLGGLALDRLGRAPKTSDTIRDDGFVLEVRSVDGARVSTLLIGPAEETDGGESDTAASSDGGIPTGRSDGSDDPDGSES